MCDGFGSGTGASETRRLRVRVEGTVQGVGFRPFVYRLAHEEGLSGHVLNDERGVVIEIEGQPAALERLLTRLRAEAPPLAGIDRVLPTEVTASGSKGFEIRQSRHGTDVEAVIAPDTATCADCLAELRDPDDRRHRYPFVNCTNCGPRLTIIEGVPYDRALTTMAGFTMCAACEAEYRDPGDRRFHAQPNACPECGPRAWLTDGSGRALSGAGDGVQAAARALAAGVIVAVKGLGGYHLACDARDQRAVARLRERKHREEKPFALMVADRRTAATVVRLGEAEARLLESPARPIVLAPRSARRGLAPSIAPGNPELGVMLAYTPLHHLLLADVAQLQGRPSVLVMTSGNLSDEPIAYDDEDALSRMGSIAERFLRHDRPIRTRVDDSVARVVDLGPGIGARPQTLRRSRGYVPTPLPLPAPARRPLLACGAELKSAFCLARGSRAWISHHIGDLEHFPARTSYVEGIAHFERLLAIRPELVAHDLHPDYASTAYAAERDGVEMLAVQHHHAHLAACLAEHACEPERRAVGAIFDGTGYGTDATVWGGEVLVGSLASFERVAALDAVRMPGGAAAIREPWRMACAWLRAVDGEQAPVPPQLAAAVDERRRRTIGQVADDPSLSPVTTSMGRLFDAVAALCGIAPEVSYEGQAAIELAAAAAGAAAGAGAASVRGYELVLRDCPGESPRRRLDPRPMIAAIATDLARGVDTGAVAAGFHAAVAAATGRVCVLAAADASVETVVLSGGVFQNRLLLEHSARILTAAGLRVLIAERVPCNDGGIAYGQAAIAARLDEITA